MKEQPFQFGDYNPPSKHLSVRLRQLGIDNPKSLVATYLKSRQPPEPNKVVQLEQPKKKQDRISADICRVV